MNGRRPGVSFDAKKPPEDQGRGGRRGISTRQDSLVDPTFSTSVSRIDADLSHRPPAPTVILQETPSLFGPSAGDHGRDPFVALNERGSRARRQALRAPSSKPHRPSNSATSLVLNCSLTIRPFAALVGITQ